MPNLYRIRTVSTGIQGLPGVTTTYFRESGGSADQAAFDMFHFWQNSQVAISNSVTLDIEDQVDVIDEGTGAIVRVDPITSGPVQGSHPGELLPFHTQGLCRLRTGSVIGGRELRGRFFLPGMVEGASASGVPDPNTVSYVNVALGNLISAVTSILSVYSPTHHASAPVQNANMWTQWAVLRSRRD